MKKKKHKERNSSGRYVQIHVFTLKILPSVLHHHCFIER